MIELVQPSTEDVTTTTEDDHPLVCTTVMHIGDSTSVGLVSKLQIPKKSERLQAQYKRVGIEEQHLSVAGARSIDGNYYNNPSGRKSAQRFRDKGYSGCWVFAMGLTDAATISAGDQVGQKERVALLMKIADGDPVLWVNLRTTASTGDYRNENMRRWNKGLRELCGTYPNMRIYDWAADVRDEWFVSDLVHYTSEGWRVRAKNIADALAKAFPAGEPVDMTNTTECMIEL